MNDRDVITRGIHTDCLLNYETVKYFGGEQHEAERYRGAIREYQALEYKVLSTQSICSPCTYANIVYSLTKYAQPGSKFHHRK
jgi:ABC-type transport system involved in Fe-S cluster assembly fused permease/ATPase subunit